jgi:hypothetical protein
LASFNTFARWNKSIKDNPAAVSASISTTATPASPPNEPLCSCILFSEEDYFLDEERKSRGPPVGFRIVILSDNGTVDDKDFKDDSD